MDRQVVETVEVDELSHTAGNKGQAQHGGQKSLGHRPCGRRYTIMADAVLACISVQGWTYTGKELYKLGTLPLVSINNHPEVRHRLN